jgi:cytochrome d ubiquinol oxidase subunit II
MNSNLSDPAFWSRFLFGAAAGNVARGVPLDAEGNFSMPFFTDFGVHGNVGLLDWYTVSVAVFAVCLLAAHGATYLALKTEGLVHYRSTRCAKYLWVAVVPLFVVISVESFFVRPDVPGQAVHNPVCWIGLVVVVLSTAMLISGFSSRREMRAFLASNSLIVGLLATGGAAIFPVMLHSTVAPENSLSAYATAANHRALVLASIWWPIGFALAIGYFIFISRQYAGKVSVKRDTQGFY